MCEQKQTPTEQKRVPYSVYIADANHRLEGRTTLPTLLAKFGLEDVYRQLHGYTACSFSWYAKNGTGRRFDHIFASRSLRVSDCNCVQDWRQDGLSDHSGIEAVFSAC